MFSPILRCMECLQRLGEYHKASCKFTKDLHYAQVHEEQCELYGSEFKAVGARS